MPNGIYALADPSSEGGVLASSEELNGMAKFVKSVFTTIEEFDDFLDDTPTKSFYNENKLVITIVWGTVAAIAIAGCCAFAVATGGTAAGLCVIAGAAIIGGLSAKMNYDSQKSSGEVDPYQVWISGFSGAISGAMAFAPIPRGLQVVGNSLLGLATGYSTGQSNGTSMISGFTGLLAGLVGGDGPGVRMSESQIKNIFMQRYTRTFNGYGPSCSCNSMLTRFTSSFRNCVFGVKGEYIVPQFSGILSGYLKGTAISQGITYENIHDTLQPAYSSIKQKVYEYFKIPMEE